MDRLVVLWARPYHLSEEEAERWARDEVRRLLNIPTVREARLSSLAAPSRRHSRPWDWMLEVTLAEADDAADCAEDPICIGWLRELSLLGARPTMVVALDGIALGEAES